MKLYFGFNKIPRVNTNGGIQFFYIPTCPIEIGDEVRFTNDLSIRHFGSAVSKQRHIVTSINPLKDPNKKSPNLIIQTTGYNGTFCCSWVTPVKSIWKKL